MPGPVLLFDIEGNGRRELVLKGTKSSMEVTRVHCICIADADDPTRHWEHGPDTLAEAWELLMSAGALVAHNGLEYDMPVLRRLVAPPGHDPDHEPPLMDTLLWSRFLWPDQRQHPNARFGNKCNSIESWGKALGCRKIEFPGPWDEFSNDMLVYCRQDVAVLARLFQHLRPRMLQWRTHSRMEHELARIISTQVECGVSLDVPGADALWRRLLEERAQLGDALQVAFPPTEIIMKMPEYWLLGEKRYARKKDCPTPKLLRPGPTRVKRIPFNPGSEKQIVARLSAKYGWKPTRRTEKGNPQMTEEVLRSLEYPEADLLFKWQMVDKRMSMLRDWMSRAEQSRDGRIHGSVTVIGTNTHRMTHSQPNITQVTKVQKDKETDAPLKEYAGRWGWESRVLFIPRPGWVFVGADAQGLELRMLANRTWPYDDGAYAQILLSGDVHTHNLQQLPILSTRPQSKEIFYATIYGCGDEKAGKVILFHKSLQEEDRIKYRGMNAVNTGKRFRQELMDGIPALGKIIDKCKGMHRRVKHVVLLDGRHAPTRSEHSALNTLLQGDGSVLCRLALVLAVRSMVQEFGPQSRGLGHGRWGLCITAHDEQQFECEEPIADRVGQIMCEAYSRAGVLLQCRVPTPGEYKIGASWGATH